jgi:hypothetical protein
MYFKNNSESFNNLIDVMDFIEGVDVYNSEIILNLDLIDIEETEVVNKFDQRLDLVVDDNINLYGVTGIKNRIRSSADIYIGKSLIKLNDDIFNKILIQW